jgi:hypothetical protein
MIDTGAEVRRTVLADSRSRVVAALTVGTAFLFLFLPGAAQAANGPRWSSSELAAFADVVITGRIVSAAPGWDPQVNAIYTYVTVDVTEVLKGDIREGRIIIKQLGGVLGDVGLSISDQATFSIGETVLLYLEARPRDGTLYTTALWQGKWAVRQDARGQPIAVSEPPHRHGGADERQLLRAARQSAAAVRDRRVAVQARPAEAPAEATADATVDRASGQFALLGPFRYLHSPAVDVQAGGQPGIPGGGFSEVLSGINRWNAVGSAFRFTPGHGSGPPRCATQRLNSGRVTISFMDPCGEMSNTGGTLAIGGSYYFAGGGGTLNGQTFDRAVEGFVINNDSAIALEFLTTPGCFEDIQTHELGHVLGLNHSSDVTALMFGTINRTSCMNAPRGLGSDDVQGLFFIYGGAVATPSAPKNVRVVSDLTSVTVTWSAPANSGGQPLTYRVDFRAGHDNAGPLVASLGADATGFTVGVPPGVIGAFNAVVTSMNAAGAGASAPRVDFTIASGQTSCTTAPPAVQGISGAVTGQWAQVQWNGIAGATSYQLHVGSAQGGADILGLTDLGPQPGAGAAVPPGFAAWVRVYAVNPCGRSQPVDFFLR